MYGAVHVVALAIFLGCSHLGTWPARWCAGMEGWASDIGAPIDLCCLLERVRSSFLGPGTESLITAVATSYVLRPHPRPARVCTSTAKAE